MKWIKAFFIPLCASLFILSCGKKGDEVSDGGDSVASRAELFTAAMENDDAAIESLAKKDFDFATTDDENNTALHIAAENGALDAVKTLIQNKAYIDAQNNMGETPIILAAKAGQVETLRYLLRQGGASNVQDNEGWSAVKRAAYAGNEEAVEALSLYSTEHLDDALFLAAVGGHSNIIDTLTNYGASVYARLDKDGRTPLMMAASHGKLDAVRVLLENGANRFSTDNEGHTASQLAFSAQHHEIADYLGESPTSDDYSLANEDSEAIKLAVEQVVKIEKQQQEVLPEKADETPLASSQLKVVALNNKQLQTAPEKPVGETLSFKTYREETLPIRVESVDDVKVSIKYLYGDHKTIDIYPGETIPETSLKIVSADMKRDHSKMTNGVPADVSKVMLEDPATGNRREMTTGLNVGRTEPFAVVKEFSGDSLIVAKQGDVFKVADGTEYEVLEVRSTQLVIMNSTTGETETIRK